MIYHLRGIFNKVFKMKKIALCLIISLCCIANLFSVSSYVIPTDSEFYSVIDLLYVLESEALPNTSRPWSEAQAKKALSYLEKNGINEENNRISLIHSSI